MSTNQDKVLDSIFTRREWMSIKEIMEKTGLSSRQSHVAVIDLQRRDLIKKKREGAYVYFRLSPDTKRVIRALKRGFGENYQMDGYNANESGNN